MTVWASSPAPGLLRLETRLLENCLQARTAQLRLTRQPQYARVGARGFLLDGTDYIGLRQRYRGRVVADERKTLGHPGARMTGGGFGGAAIALVPDEACGGLLEAFGDAAFEVRPVGGVRRTGPMG